jgi:predicted nucleotidyltransferase
MKSKRAALILRVPPSLHQQLKQEARSADMSLNKHCLGILGGKARTSPARRSTLNLRHPPSASSPTNALKDLAARVLETVGDDVEALVLFGSFARGQELEGSDIDLLVVLNDHVALDRDVYSRWQFGKFFGREVSPLFVQIPAEGERIGGLWFEVALEGVVLFDRDLRLSRFLSRVRNYIAVGRIRRMITHGHPYWVHSGEVVRNLPLE